MQNKSIIRKTSLISLSLLFIFQITAGVLLPINISPNILQIQTNKAYAADSTWEGDISTDWNTAGNWSLNAVPDSTTNVTIPDAATTTNDPAISSGANVGNVIIATDGILNGNANTINVYGDWTNSGTFNHGSGTVVFTGITSKIFTPSTSAYNNVEVNKTSSSGFDDFTISGTATVSGNLTHTNGNLNGGQIDLAGDYIVGSAASGTDRYTTATIINFNHVSNDQTITYTSGGIGAHVRIDKAGGTFSITNTISLNGWTYVTGTVTGLDTYTLTFKGDSSGTFTPGALAYSNIEIDKTNSSTGYDNIIVSGTATVSGNLTQTNGNLDGGQINLAGNYIIGANATGSYRYSTATIINFNHASNDQTITYTSGGIGAHVRIDKAGGTFSITDTVLLNSWTYVTGTVTGLDTYTLTFKDDSTGKFIPGSLSYTNIEVNMTNSGTAYDDLTITGTATVSGNLTHTNGDLDGGQINLAGNYIVGALATGTDRYASSAIINFNHASNDQTIIYTAGGTAAHARIDKAGGTFSITDTIPLAGWTYITGTITGLDTYTLTIKDDSSGTFTPGNFVYNDIEINMIEGNGYDDLTVSGTVTVSGNFTHTDGNLNGGQINLAGNYIVGAAATGSDRYAVATIINFNHASNDQTITYTSGGIGTHVRIDKAGGTFSITNNISINSWTYITGTVSGVDTYVLNFNDDYHGSFTHGSLTYGNVEISRTGSLYDDFTISSGTLDINGNLTLTDGDIKFNTNNPDINIAGNLSIASAATFTKGAGTLTFDGSTASTFTDSSASPQDVGSVVINKTGESLTLLSDTLITTLAVSGTSTLILGADLTVSGDTAINNGATLTYTQGTAVDLTVNGTLTVYSGGTILTPYTSLTVPDSGGSGRTITAGNVDIQSGGTINADGLGFGVNAGPGKCTNASTYDSASYGGRGADYDDLGISGPTYGSLSNPISLGSGGRSDEGGGAIIISSTGTVTVNGILSTDGNGSEWGASGSGGTVNITANILTGSGIIRANGGNSVQRGSGGGGRLSLNGVTTDNFLGTLQANGGNTATKGNTGTIYLNSTKRANLVLGGAGNLTSLRLGTDDTATAWTFGTITIQSGGILEIGGNPYLNSNNGGAATLIITTLDVQSGGILSANGLGFGLREGPGKNTNASTYDGVSYGGRGADYDVVGVSGPTYGSITNPIYLGSAGRSDEGGGAIIISSSGTVTINGILSADGDGGDWASGGSGGTINITTPTLSGSGTIRANGGASVNRGSGGGGRIAITQTTGTTWTPTLQAFGGSGNTTGAAGTIYLKDANDTAGDGELIIDNNNDSTASGTDTDISSLVTDTAVGNVIIRNSGKLQMDTDTTLTVSGTWTNTAGENLTAGTVILDGTSQSVIGNTNFYNLTKNVTSTDTLTFGNGTTQIIIGTMDLQGASGNLLSLRSDSTPIQWSIDPQGTRTISYLDVKDSNNINATVIDASGLNITDSDNNTNWLFNVVPNVPTLISPASTSNVSDNTPTLSANYTDTDTNDTGTTNYRISSSSLADCTTNTNVVSSGTSSTTSTNNENTTWTPSSSIGADATYYWCAQNNDGIETSAWTQMGSFNLDTTNPTITNISSDKPNSTYNIEEVIDIDVTFSENVTSTGNVTITLETGTTD
ncbi:MAG: hypothetical protein KAS01_01080, partial [Candidatus Pacebacteria bacterium]|nr:hypothetical protein [Candidatus Paceibacterota bacterium]